MGLTEQEARFLAKRTGFLKAWPYVGAALLVGLAGFVGWLVWFAPLLANPFVVLSRLQDDAIAPSTMALSAALLPIVVLMCLFLAMAVVLLMFAAFANERKYQAIVQRMRSRSS